MMTLQTKPTEPTSQDKIISMLIWILGSVYFVLLIPFAILLMMLFKPQTYDKAVKRVCRFFIRGLFIRVRLEGLENIEPNKTYIFMSNHVNIFDAFILNGHIPNFIRAVELDTHFTWPIYGTAIRRFGNIPISHENPRQALESLKKAGQALDDGISIIILPEGTRTLDGNLKPFKRGPFFMAKNVRFDIVPVALQGSHRVKRKGHPLIRPGTVVCRIGEIIPSVKIHQMQTNDLRHHVRDRMQKMMEQ